MKHLTTILLLTGVLTAAIYDIYTEQLDGRLVIERGDSIIVHPSHSLAKGPSYINIKLCTTTTCRKEYIAYMKHRYRTNGITIQEIK